MVTTAKKSAPKTTLETAQKRLEKTRERLDKPVTKRTPAKKAKAETPAEPVLIPPIAPPAPPEIPKGQIIRSVRFDKVTKNYYILETRTEGDQISTRHSKRQFETIERTREHIDSATPLQFTEWFSY